MKKAPAIFIISFLLLGLSSTAQHTLVTEMSGIKAMQGNLYFSIYDRESAWMYSDEAYEKVLVPVKNEVEMIILNDLPPGDYAIAVYQDLNENGSMDETEMKIPKEPFGFSNNPRGKRGPASFQQALFHFDEADTVNIELVNNLFTPNKEKNGDQK